MKSTTEAISIKITKEEGKELRNQIIKLTNGNMAFNTEYRDTAIAKLCELLTGNFESSYSGVHQNDKSNGGA